MKSSGSSRDVSPERNRQRNAAQASSGTAKRGLRSPSFESRTWTVRDAEPRPDGIGEMIWFTLRSG
jgi:hypothetical protein